MVLKIDPFGDFPPRDAQKNASLPFIASLAELRQFQRGLLDILAFNEQNLILRDLSQYLIFVPSTRPLLHSPVGRHENDQPVRHVLRQLHQKVRVIFRNILVISLSKLGSQLSL